MKLVGFLWWFNGTDDLAGMADRTRRSLSIGAIPEAAARVVDGAGLISTAAEARSVRSWQPARTASGTTVLFAGRLGNRDALIRQIMPGGAPALDDAALYGRLFDDWGEAADTRVVGAYAAILWRPDTQTATLVRSPVSGPPLHIWRDDQKLLVASVPRGLFATGAVPRELDDQKIADSLFLNYTEGDRSWYRGISRLAAGTRLTVTPGKATHSRYYDLAALPDIRLPRDDDYVEAASELMSAAAKDALAGCTKPAIMLSGGFDSQAVAAYAMPFLPQGGSLRGFTAVPEPDWSEPDPAGRFSDESAHVRALAEMHPGLDVEFISASGLELSHNLDRLFLLCEAPPRNAMNLYWIHESHASATRSGCDVMLTGALGNATFSFSGEGYLPSLLRAGKLGTLYHELRAKSASGRSVAWSFAGQALLPLMPRPIWALAMRLHRGRAVDAMHSWSPLNPDYARTMRVAERAADMGFDPAFRHPASTKGLRRAILGNAANESGDLEQGFAALHGIEMRDPTGYRPLLEFCMGIPDDQYVRTGQTRWLARRMLRGKVPQMVIDETRRGLQAADWHLRLGRVRGELLAEIKRFEGVPEIREILDLTRLRQALENWPDAAPKRNSAQAQTLQLALTRGLTTARFIQYVSGKNW